LQQLPSLTDIEKFVNGFKIEKLTFPKVTFPVSYANPLTASPIDSKFANYKTYYRLVMCFSIIFSIVLAIVNPWFVVLGIVAIAILNETLPWKKQIKEELKKREIEFAGIKGKLEAAIKEYNFPGELKNYNNSAFQMEQLITRFRNLPNELQTKRKAMEERLYTEQLHWFLSSFDIRSYAIPSFGASRKLSLYTAGIRNASDISGLAKIKVQGIGPKFEQILFSWQRQMASKFVYHPDNTLIGKEYHLMVTEIEQTKRNLENEIKKEYQSLHYLKMNIQNRQQQLQKYIDLLGKQYFQAELDLKEFKRIAA
jgi:DNA-binding helix-hairpin-helix protein with protein kinase domain